MKKLFWIIMIISFMASSAFAQSNKIVFGPLVGDDAGVLTVRNGDDIEIDVWVRTDPSNPAPIVALAIGLMSNDSIIAERNCAVFNPDYYWEYMGCERLWPNPDDPFPIPEGHTAEFIWAYCSIFHPEGCDTLDTGGEWDYFASFLMVCNTAVPIDSIYYPFSAGWYPHSGQGTNWSFEAPPGGSIQPEQDYCGLFFEPETTGVDQNQSLPDKFFLAQNHPNPFNATTTIKYSLAEASDVTIEIYDILGRKIETLVLGKRPAGWHSVVWDAENLPSGVYLYRIKAGEHVESRSCLLLK